MESSDQATIKDVSSLDITPVYSTLEALSGGSDVNLGRYKRLVQAFEKRFGHAPRFLARAPGRVNLIGEHVDYCGYSVLPMAIEQDIAMAVRTTDTQTLTLTNVEDKYADHEQPSSEFNINGHEWYNYFLCGYRGVLEKFSVAQPQGLQVMVDGNIPPSSGLSSSSALVCCSSLVTLLGNKLSLPPKTDIANLCAASERFIGTQGGGMDQAISFLAQPGKAFKIDFNPLKSTEVSLPEGHSFIIASSLVKANKAAFSGYNERVVECQLATKLIAKARGLDWRSIFKLAELQEQLGVQLGNMTGVVKDYLHEHPYTHSEICKLLEIPDGKLVEEVLSHMSMQAKDAAQRLPSFKLYQRATHVYSEANRVIQFKESTEDGQLDACETAKRLGMLMNGSHSSCSDLYQCSCPELDELVSLCRQGGAYGSRLTGAGWGGCSVSLVPKQKLSEFLDFVAGNFYKNSLDAMADSLFATNPGSGAAICEVK